MRILHILDHSLPLHSGYTFRTEAIIREQRALGWETSHLTSPKQGTGAAASEDVAGLRFHRTRPGSASAARLPLLREWQLMRALRERVEGVIEEVRPDIVHAHSPVLNALPAMKAASRFGLPMVYEIRAFWEDAAVDHGTTAEGSARYRLTRALETWAIRSADHVFTICEGLAADIRARGINSNKVTVIPNAVDVSSFPLAGTKDPALLERWGLAGRTVLGFIGSFYAYEGLDPLLAALPGLLERTPGLALLLVGGGPQEQKLRERVEQLRLSTYVAFTGRVPHDEVDRYYDLIDILVYPRHRMRLTELVTPLKPLEAMAKGKLLVASDVGGHRELIEHGRTGVLFHAGDAESLTREITALLAQPDLWPQLGREGRRFVESERNWRKSVAGYVEPYGRLRVRSTGARP